MTQRDRFAGSERLLTMSAADMPSAASLLGPSPAGAVWLRRRANYRAISPGRTGGPRRARLLTDGIAQDQRHPEAGPPFLAEIPIGVCNREGEKLRAPPAATVGLLCTPGCSLRRICAAASGRLAR